MNKFEAVLLISPEISNQILQKEIENFTKDVKEKKGSVVNSESWGLRDLSYNISGFKKAFYTFFQLELDGDKIKLIKNNLTQNDNIIRHLFIKVENHQELPTKLYNEKK